MIITRAGKRFEIVEDTAIDEDVPLAVRWSGGKLVPNQRVLHQITILGESSGEFPVPLRQIAKGASRAHCLLGLLDQGFTIEREPDDPDDLDTV